MLDRVLARTGLHLVMWTRRGFDTRCGDAETVRQRLLRQLAAGDILLLHDGHAARTAQGEPVALAVLPDLLQALRARHLQAVTLRQGLADLTAESMQEAAVLPSTTTPSRTTP